MRQKSAALSMIVFAFFAFSSFTGCAEALYSDDSNRLDTKFYISPYAWLIGLHGTVGTAGYTTKVEAPFRDSLSNVDFAGMLAMEVVFRNRYGITMNLNFVDLGDQASVKGVALCGETSMFFSSAALFYRIASHPLDYHPSSYINVDLLAGINYWDVNLKLDVESQSLGSERISRGADWIDPVFGARAQIRLDDKWTLNIQGLLGMGGDTESTWDASARLGYKIGNNSTLMFGYRAVNVNRREGNSFVFNSTLRGPIIGCVFSF